MITFRDDRLHDQFGTYQALVLTPIDLISNLQERSVRVQAQELKARVGTDGTRSVRVTEVKGDVLDLRRASKRTRDRMR